MSLNLTDRLVISLRAQNQILNQIITFQLSLSDSVKPSSIGSCHWVITITVSHQLEDQILVFCSVLGLSLVYCIIAAAAAAVTESDIATVVLLQPVTVTVTVAWTT
jgi:hypothetical protein